MKTSKIWFIETDLLKDIVKNSFNMHMIIKSLGLIGRHDIYKNLQKRLDLDKIDYSHLSSKTRSSYQLRNIDSVLVKNSCYSRHALKNRLFKLGLLKNQCIICGQLPKWNEKPLVLHIDHINGISNDNRIENLRILCPHCHSQTDTFGGRNIKNLYLTKSVISKSIIKKKCIGNHDPRPLRRKVPRPSKIQLEILINQKSFRQLGKDFGVSDNAIRKWCMYYKIHIPTRKDKKKYCAINKLIVAEST